MTRQPLQESGQAATTTATATATTTVRVTAARFGLPALALLLWCTSLWLPSVDVRGGPVVSGYELLLRGWEGVGRGLYAWLANPAFIVALIVALFPRYARPALFIAAVALALAASSFVAETLLRWHGTSVPAIGFEPGFYVWLAAVGVLCMHAAIRAHRQQANTVRSS